MMVARTQIFLVPEMMTVTVMTRRWYWKTTAVGDCRVAPRGIECAVVVVMVGNSDPPQKRCTYHAAHAAENQPANGKGAEKAKGIGKAVGRSHGQ
mmetsp:Transcript_26624/g.73247  ORF Transcript_26624/g.73247 Transcript_26624/m.73247 type:complete len:95 (-) Transcript_26624:1402-1686(-)